MTTTEIWAPIPGYEDAYLLSSRGTVYSLPRSVPSANRWGECERAVGGYFKIARRGQVALCRNGTRKYVTVAHIVREVFG